MRLGDYINPFSNAQQEAREHFSELSGWSRLGVVLGTALAAIFTFPALGWGGVAAFKALSDYSWSLSRKREMEKVRQTYNQQFVILEDDDDDNEDENKLSEQSKVDSPKLEEKKEENACMKLLEELKDAEVKSVKEIMEKYKPAEGKNAPLENANREGFFQLLVENRTKEISKKVIQEALKYISTSSGDAEYWGLDVVWEDKSRLVNLSLKRDILHPLIQKMTSENVLNSLLRVMEDTDTKKVILNRIRELGLALKSVSDMSLAKDLILMIDLGDVSTAEGAAKAYKFIGSLLSNEQIKRLSELQLDKAQEARFYKNIAFLKVYPFYKQYIVDDKKRKSDLERSIGSYKSKFNGNEVGMCLDIEKVWGKESFHSAIRNFK